MLEEKIHPTLPTTITKRRMYLTPREVEVLKSAASLHYKCVAKHISEDLGIAKSTVKNHLGKIYESLGVNDIFSAICFALENRVLLFEEIVSRRLLNMGTPQILY